MKFKVTLKDPDGFDDCIIDAIEDSLPDGLTPREEKALRKVRREEIDEQMSKWIEHGEYVVIEFDLVAMTATVVQKE